MNTLHRDGLPRNGRYELFIFNGRVNCYDDPLFDAITESEELHEWISQQPKKLWSCMEPPYHKIAYYLQPVLYSWFVLRWS